MNATATWLKQWISTANETFENKGRHKTWSKYTKNSKAGVLWKLT
jgi:hypothetical protein